MGWSTAIRAGLVASLVLFACGCGATMTAPSSLEPPRSIGKAPAGTASASAPGAFLIHFANRSASAITVGPGLSIPACGWATASRTAYDAARLRAGEMAAAGQTWDAPAGALVWGNMAVGFEPTQDLTVVISGTAPVAVRLGVVAEADLPECGGAPMGIEPGLPQGVELTVTPLP
jgi:hypothetical protein